MAAFQVLQVLRFANLNKHTIEHDKNKQTNKQTSSVYDCTVEDVEYIYNKLSI